MKTSKSNTQQQNMTDSKHDTSEPPEMAEARAWAARLVKAEIITQAQSECILASHCSALGTDGRSYGLCFDPTKYTKKAQP